MHSEELSRRDFHRLSAAALGGLIAGATIGCGDEGSKSAPKPATSASDAKKASSSGADKTAVAATPVSATSPAIHACRGLNECKGNGKDHKNNCAGQGSCYTVSHDCSGKNDCKLQGGCGSENGLNDCKGKGGCGHFPIADDAWKKAREAFEARMKKANKKFGKAPEPASA